MHFGRIFNYFLPKSMCLSKTCLPYDINGIVKTSLEQGFKIFT